MVHAYLPVEASFGLADELRRSTSGAASASLLLSHWQRLQVGVGWGGVGWVAWCQRLDWIGGEGGTVAISTLWVGESALWRKFAYDDSLLSSYTYKLTNTYRTHTDTDVATHVHIHMQTHANLCTHPHMHIQTHKHTNTYMLHYVLMLQTFTSTHVHKHPQTHAHHAPPCRLTPSLCRPLRRSGRSGVRTPLTWPLPTWPRG